MYLNEGLNDRFEGIKQANKNITSDIKVDRILNSTPISNIYFSTDWHLYKFDKETKRIYKNPDAERIIDNHNKIVSDKDVSIFLGDMVDDECQNYKELEYLIKDRLNGYKILILGNNDMQPESYYNSLGFSEIFFAYQWGKLTFSHEPLANYNTEYNIHGHMHEWWDYTYQGISWKNHIKIYNKEYGWRPISLEEILERWKRGYFTKNIK